MSLCILSDLFAILNNESSYAFYSWHKASYFEETEQVNYTSMSTDTLLYWPQGEWKQSWE